ncbi:MAG TPA: glycosyltransferase N-terminal domain-containing protein, partial [Chitinophagaceae bacterium]|nr:glycosyltransferase N-terminal domain-containing protein [Chitinophagaceae bacterium]
MISLYNIFIFLFNCGIRIAALWNDKAKEWLEGRRNLWVDLENNLPKQKQIVWFHVASAGEFEQGKPLMEAIKKTYPTYSLVISFFSPSGYKVAKKSSVADYIFYLPLDTKNNAERLLQLMQPQIVVFVKYDIWYHHLQAIKKANVSMLLISAVFRPHQLYFRWYGGFYKRMLPSFSQIFVQDVLSLTLLAEKGINNAMVSGDTRIDRVIRVKDDFTAIPHIKEFIGASTVLVAGSTWVEDEELLKSLADVIPGIKLILAPHEIDATHLKTIRERFSGSLFYSEVKEGKTLPASAHVLVIDNVGMLSRLYYYATIAFIGGGFSKDGIHNSLEAAVFGKPLIWGPNYSKYREAVDLVEAGAGTSV